MSMKVISEENSVKKKKCSPFDSNESFQIFYLVTIQKKCATLFKYNIYLRGIFTIFRDRLSEMFVPAASAVGET